MTSVSCRKPPLNSSWDFDEVEQYNINQDILATFEDFNERPPLYCFYKQKDEYIHYKMSFDGFPEWMP